MTSKLRALLVADAAENAGALSALLTQTGCDVTLAEPTVAPPPCDIVVVDITRPRFSPYANLQAQRRMGCSAPAIVLSTRISEQMAGEMLSMGIRDFIMRPIEEAALLERLRQFVNTVQQTHIQSEVTRGIEQSQAALARRMEELSAISRIGRAIASVSDLDTMLAHIVDAGVFLTHAEEGAIFLADEGSDSLILRAEKGLGAKQAEVIRSPAQDSDAVAVLRTGKPIMKSADTEHKVKTGYLVRALINVPIVIRQKTEGVLAVYNHGGRSFASSDQAVLSNLADYAAIALDKVRAVQQLQAQMAHMNPVVQTPREVLLHVQSLAAPIEGIESLVVTLLDGGFGALNEQQRDTVIRIKNAVTRLNEIAGFIKEAAQGAEAVPAGK